MDFSALSTTDYASSAANIGMIVASIVLVIVALVGVVITLVGLPGIILVYASIVIYALLTGFDSIGTTALILGALVVVVFFISDNVAVAMGAKMAKASRWAALAAFVGGIVGLIFFGPLGALFGPLVCVLIVEYYTDPNIKKALRAGIGAFLGYIAGILIRFLLATSLFIWFIIQVV